MRMARVGAGMGQSFDGHAVGSRVVTGVAAVLLGVRLAHGGLVQYWAFDDVSGATAANAASGGNAGALVNFTGSGWNTDVPAPLAHSSGSLAFSSAGTNYVNGGALGLYATGTVGEVTLSFWLKPQTLGDTRLLSQLEKAPSKNPSGSIQISASADFRTGKLQVFNATSGLYTALSPAGALSTGVWQHVALTWRGSEVTCYIAGNRIGITTNAFEFDRDTAGTAFTFGIGARFKSMYGESYNGKMDDLAVWNKALSSSQIRTLATGKSPLLIDLPAVPQKPPLPLAGYRLDGNAFDIGGSYHGTVTNGAAFTNGAANTPFSYAGNMALQLDGANDEVTLPNVADLRPRTNAWTLSVWFKAAAANQQGSLICNRLAVSPYTQVGITVGGSTRGTVGQGRLLHFLTLDPASRWEAFTTNVFADGSWHHVALTRGSKAFAPDVYVDGELVPLGVIDYPSAVVDVSSTDPWRIGSIGVAGYYFKGLIDEVALWDTALSDGQVAWLARNSLTALPPKGTLISIH